MYNIDEEITDEQLQQYAMQMLSDKEQANRLFEEVKALKVFDHLASTVKIKSKKIDYDKFEKLDN
ncbi:MAG TPA: trigger factor, partial [Sphingobacterium sp.]|nr:trigger factor [Sphingobacterium sp.]